MAESKTFTLYILICGKGEYYTGITSNLEKRLRAHQLGYEESNHFKPQWTKFRQPVQLAFKYEGIENFEIAKKIERYIKTWRRAYKYNLIQQELFAMQLIKQCHQKHLEEYRLKSGTSLHTSQIQHPCIVHTQK
ncbi:MAG: GIY-YIG nuclease family protein [Bacteroidota bacterium]|nr:GIY-YIG nuclease family protein [Bacteroidota bacterium]